MGLVLDSSGFLKRSRIVPGNVSEPNTLAYILTCLKVEENATIIMNAGFASEENLTLLKKRWFEYIVVSRKRSLCMPEEGQSVLVKVSLDNQVRARLVENIHASWDSIR